MEKKTDDHVVGSL